MTALRAGAATDVGLVRSNNQDRLLLAAPLFAVADGMGGHAAGEVASQTAVRALREAFGPAPAGTEGVATAVRQANRAVWDKAQSNVDFRGMGTTLTALALVDSDGDEAIAIANVGDSRTYRLHRGTFEQLTVDHNLVAELVAGGQIGEDEAETHPQRHVLTRALGVYPDVDVDVLATPAEAGDRYLLCSDGLSRELTDSQIASVLRRLADPDDAARELVTAAKLAGGSDNITVVVVDVLDEAVPEPQASGEEAEGNEPAGAADESVAAPSRRDRRASRRAAKANQRPLQRRVTLRVVGFVVLLLAVVGAGIGGTAWYARDAYFVGLDANRVTIFQGRPGGLLWWQPTVEQTTAVTAHSVEAYHLPALRAGVQEANLVAARRFVANLRAEAVAARLGSTPTTTTTVPPTTTTTTAAKKSTP